MSKWDNEYVIKAVEELLGTDTYDNIAKQMNTAFPQYQFSGEAIRCWRKRQNGINTNIPQLSISVDDITEVPLSLYHFPDVKEKVDQIYKDFSHVRTIAVLTDLHFPFHDSYLLQKCYDNTLANNCDLIVLGGDILQSNKFGKYGDTNIPFKLEFEIAVDWIRKLKLIAPVVMISGNHDRWLQRYLKNRAATSEFDFMFDNGMDPIGYLANKTNTIYAENWWVQIGPCVISHPDRYASPPLKNIKNSIEYFLPRIRDKYWDTIIQGHSHQAGSGKMNGLNYFETGCMCNRMDYNTGPSQTQPIWQQAYAILKLTDNKLDFNNSKLIVGRTLI